MSACPYNLRLSTQRHLEVLPPRTRLESWKEIAAYLNRSERTVRRWEDKEGLPIHRLQHDKRGSVYAYTSELDAWRESRRQLMADEPSDSTSSAFAGRRRALLWLAVAATVVLTGSLVGYWALSRPSAAPVAATRNPEAVRLVELAFFAGNAGRVQIQTGIRYYQDAIRLDPHYARAWAGLATAHLASTWFAEGPPSETMTQARSEAQQAVRLDPSAGPPWKVLAFVSHYLDWDHPRAETEFHKAIALSPRDPGAHSWLGDFLVDMRRFDEARTAYKQAHDVNPRWLEPTAFAGNVHLFAGNADLAIAEYRRTLESEPNFGLGNHFLGRAYLAKGLHDQAIAQLRKSNDLLGQVPFSIGDLGYALALAGKSAEAEALVADLIARRERGYYPAFAIAVIRLGLGEVEAALDWLERAADERHMGFYMPSVDPTYDTVRSHPRFKAIMTRARLPQ
jgi:tetratricopeptide (TPR) repeat protein